MAFGQLPDNYRDGTKDKNCGNCVFEVKATKWCRKWRHKVEDSKLCNSWVSDSERLYRVR